KPPKRWAAKQALKGSRPGALASLSRSTARTSPPVRSGALAVPIGLGDPASTLTAAEGTALPQCAGSAAVDPMGRARRNVLSAPGRGRRGAGPVVSGTLQRSCAGANAATALTGKRGSGTLPILVSGTVAVRPSTSGSAPLTTCPRWVASTSHPC